MSNDSGGVLGAMGAFVLGVAAGAGLALLFAPQAGAETRRVIRGKAEELKALLEEKRGLVEKLLAEGEDAVRAKIREQLRKLDEKLAAHEKPAGSSETGSA